ncbi:SidA/IucD/PvdA family monooxygenase [Scytonema hofmannii]|uniref:SidA/IucD/PvdA family monooxygenase n=1 Tax=Scytonema hofmannii TaxID=34078 RepID=UPI0009D6C354
MKNFLFFGQFHIPRREYNHYCPWVAEQLPICRFGERVEALSWDENRHDFAVKTQRVDGTNFTYRTSI